jgi:hypothetical protein
VVASASMGVVEATLGPWGWSGYPQKNKTHSFFFFFAFWGCRTTPLANHLQNGCGEPPHISSLFFFGIFSFFFLRGGWTTPMGLRWLVWGWSNPPSIDQNPFYFLFLFLFFLSFGVAWLNHPLGEPPPERLWGATPHFFFFFFFFFFLGIFSFLKKKKLIAKKTFWIGWEDEIVKKLKGKMGISVNF